MKKILTAVSLILVFVMLMAVPAFAEEAEWTPPSTSPIYYANNIAGKDAPIIDGEITDGEYGDLTVRLVDHLKLMQSYPENAYMIDDDREDFCSEYIDFYISYDENFFYLAFVDYGSSWEAKAGDKNANFTSRNNYSFGIGFELDYLTNYFSIAIEGARISASFSDGKVSNFTTLEEGFAGIVSEAYLKKYLRDDPSKVFCDADLTTLSGSNKNSTEGAYVAVCELKFDKKVMLEFIKNYSYIEYETLPDAMFFHMTARSYVLLKDDLTTQNADATSYNKYFASDIRNVTEDYYDYGVLPGSPVEFMPSLVVFGDENTVLTIPEEIEFEFEEEEEEFEVEEETELVEETEEEVVETLAAPVEEKGCGGSIAFAGLSLVVTLGLVTAFVTKKKEY